MSLNHKTRRFLGVDIGGTSVKIALCDGTGRILRSSSFRTQASERSSEEIVLLIVEHSRELSRDEGIQPHEIAGMGIGSPGSINVQKGEVIFAGNLPFKNFPLKASLEKELGMAVVLGNDANVAALAEHLLGAGRGSSFSMTITIGTGIGSGIIIDGNIYAGANGAGCECGHMVIHRGGEACSCGRRGCFEAYASAPALIRRTKERVEQYPDSLLAGQAHQSRHIGGRTAFQAAAMGCPVAKNLLNDYFEDLAIGLGNLANCFFPERMILGGGISQEGEAFKEALQPLFEKELFKAEGLPQPQLYLAELGNRAGVIGAALMAEKALYGD